MAQTINYERVNAIMQDKVLYRSGESLGKVNYVAPCGERGWTKVFTDKSGCIAIDIHEDTCLSLCERGEGKEPTYYFGVFTTYELK